MMHGTAAPHFANESPQAREAAFEALRQETYVAPSHTPKKAPMTNPNAKTMTVPLNTPISVAGTVADALTFRAPNLGDLIAAERAEVKGIHENSAFLMSRMAGITPEEMGALSYADYLALDAALQPLMGNGSAPEAGAS